MVGGRDGSRVTGTRRQREVQELNRRIGFHNLDWETTTQTFMLHTRPNPLCDSTSVKQSSPWSSDESKKVFFSRRSLFVFCVRTSSYDSLTFCEYFHVSLDLYSVYVKKIFRGRICPAGTPWTHVPTFFFTQN
jgi:hypothetical protein